MVPQTKGTGSVRKSMEVMRKDKSFGDKAAFSTCLSKTDLFLDDTAPPSEAESWCQTAGTSEMRWTSELFRNWTLSRRKCVSVTDWPSPIGRVSEAWLVEGPPLHQTFKSLSGACLTIVGSKQ